MWRRMRTQNSVGCLEKMVPRAHDRESGSMYPFSYRFVRRRLCRRDECE